MEHPKSPELLDQLLHVASLRDKYSALQNASIEAGKLAEQALGQSKFPDMYTGIIEGAQSAHAQDTTDIAAEHDYMVQKLPPSFYIDQSLDSYVKSRRASDALKYDGLTRALKFCLGKEEEKKAYLEAESNKSSQGLQNLRLQVGAQVSSLLERLNSSIENSTVLDPSFVKSVERAKQVKKTEVLKNKKNATGLIAPSLQHQINRARERLVTGSSQAALERVWNRMITLRFPIAESSVVKYMFPDLYETDRIAAYDLFDAAWQQHLVADRALVPEHSHLFLQRGSVESVIGQTARRISRRNVYMAIAPMDYKNFGSRQRFTQNGKTYEVTWDHICVMADPTRGVNGE